MADRASGLEQVRWPDQAARPKPTQLPGASRAWATAEGALGQLGHGSETRVMQGAENVATVRTATCRFLRSSAPALQAAARHVRALGRSAVSPAGLSHRLEVASVLVQHDLARLAVGSGLER